MFDQQQQRILNDWQRDLPLEPRPYARMAEKLEMTEAEVIEALQSLKLGGAISRVGAVVKPGTIGASTLAAMSVPPEHLDTVAKKISVRPEVNHNYERDHHFNLWFVVTASDSETLEGLLAEIEAECGFGVMSLPLVEAYHIDLGFDLRFPAANVEEPS
jgi:siroheme decarboxylase